MNASHLSEPVVQAGLAAIGLIVILAPWLIAESVIAFREWRQERRERLEEDVVDVSPTPQLHAAPAGFTIAVTKQMAGAADASSLRPLLDLDPVKPRKAIRRR